MFQIRCKHVNKIYRYYIFWTNTHTQTDGFVVRATCIDPMRASLPGCTNFAFTEIWDKPFTDSINRLFEKVGIHKWGGCIVLCKENNQ